MAPMPQDDDFLDGCDIDFTEDPDDDLTAGLRLLFPDGKPNDKLVADLKEAFGDS